MKFIPNVVSRAVGRQMLIAQKNSPKMMFVGGLIGVVGSSVLACRATLKLMDTLDEIKEEVDTVKRFKAPEDTLVHSSYPMQEYNRDLAFVYGKGTLRIVKLYTPALLLGGASIGALTGSHVTLTRRNASLTAAYALVSESFEAYRERVRKELGDEREKNVYHAITMETASIGGEKQTIPVADPNRWSPYARFFEESNRNWQKNAELNRLFIQCQQNYANDILRARGHVFLNEVYDMLGLEHSQAGAVVGWIIGDHGDNYIDFGIFDAANSSFINGWERNVILDFNVDGVIYDKIG